MSFRWSAGDIVKCVELIVRVSKGLKDSSGAAAEYEAAVGFLDGLEATLDKLKEHLETHSDSFYGDNLAEQAERLKAAVEKFKVKAEKFEASLGSDSSRSSLRRAPRKIQWTLFADNIKELQTAISNPQNVLNTILLLQTLKAAEHASQISTLSQQELARIGISVFNILPAQLASSANDLKEVLLEKLDSITEDQQSEKLQRRDEIQQLRESIDQQTENYASLEVSLQVQQRLVLDTLESCIQAHLDALFEALRLNDASANEPAEVDSTSPRNDEENTDTNTLADDYAEVEGASPQADAAELHPDMSMFVGMAAGLHMLGYLMSGMMAPMLRAPVNGWATSGNESGYYDSASIDARFLAMFDNIALSLENCTPVEFTATIPKESWAKELGERTETQNLAENPNPLGQSLGIRPAPMKTPQPTSSDTSSRGWVSEFQANADVLKDTSIATSLAYAKRERAFATCTFIFCVGSMLPHALGAPIHTNDAIDMLESHKLDRFDSTGHLYRWSKGKISRVTGSVVLKKLYSSTTVMRLSDDRYFAKPGDPIHKEGRWDRLSFVSAMSTEVFKFLHYEWGLGPGRPGTPAPDTSELQKWAKVPWPTIKCMSGRIELILAYIAHSFRPEDVDRDLIAQQPWKLSWWSESRNKRATLPRPRAVSVQVWLESENPGFSTVEGLSILETCPVFLYSGPEDFLGRDRSV